MSIPEEKDGIDVQVEVMIMAFHSLERPSQERFLQSIKQEIEDEEFFELLQKRAKTSKALSENEAKDLRNYLKSA
ncbi:MAG: hypothetical protein SFU25_11650 [Candidatus Caenarcaniphilales bacterium]|nr:hypothetical protein [Candidatus Caenarcaniphilales bacterium]